jgi:hypothetical protein
MIDYRYAIFFGITDATRARGWRSKKQRQPSLPAFFMRRQRTR